MTTVIKPTQPWDEDPIILCIVCVTIIVTLIGDFIKCLLTIHLPRQKQCVVGSTGTTRTLIISVNQPPSVSTNVPLGTVDQKKVGPRSTNKAERHTKSKTAAYTTLQSNAQKPAKPLAKTASKPRVSQDFV